MVKRITHIRHHSVSGNAFVCSYWDKVGQGDVTDDNISHDMKFEAKMLGYKDQMIPLDWVDTYSLQSGGACTLSVTWYLDREIMKMGRWSQIQRSS